MLTAIEPIWCFGCEAIVPSMATVLVVSDASWVANGVRASLAVGDWDIAELDDPRLALDTVLETRPESMVVDMQVGSMGGMAVVRAIRDEVEPEVRPRMVLLLDRSADRFLAHRAGADASVLKPFNSADLRLALDPGAGEEE